MQPEPPLIEVIIFLALVIGGISAAGGWLYAFFHREGSLVGKGYVDQAALDFTRPSRVIMWGGLLLLAAGIGLLLGLWAARAVSDLARHPTVESASRALALVGLAFGGCGGMLCGLGQILPFERSGRLISVPTWTSRIARVLFWAGTGLMILAAALGVVTVVGIGAS